MNEPLNPYAPPKAQITAHAPLGTGRCWREGNLVVMEIGSLMPCRCVKCNEPAVTPVRGRRVTWHSPWWYLLILLNILIYVLVALIVQKKAMIAPGLCALHKKRRSKMIAIAWLVFFAGTFLGTWGAITYGQVVGFTGLGLVLVSFSVGTAGSKTLVPSLIDAQLVKLKGAGQPFLDSLEAA